MRSPISWWCACVCLAGCVSIGATRLSGQGALRLLEAPPDAPAPVAALYRALALPADRIQLADGESADIEPLGPDNLLDPQFAGNVTVQAIAVGDAPARQLVLTRPTLAAYLPFEAIALNRIAQFDKEASDLPAIQRLAADEQVLKVLLNFHLSTRDRPLQGTNRWADTQAEVERKLLDVRCQLLRARMLSAHDQEQWRQALQFADAMGNVYPNSPAALTAVAHLKTRYALFTLLQGGTAKQTAAHYLAVRQQLAWLDEHFPRPPAPDILGLLGDMFVQVGSPVVAVYQPDAEAIRQVLQRKAALLLSAARKSKDDKQAVRVLEAAAEIWPQLPGLNDDLLKHKGQYAVLYVGVRALPKYLSPARAFTDSERQALELIFESLVQTRPGEEGRLLYRPQLAGALPALTGFERQLTLRPAAAWSNGTRVSSADVLKTFELLTAAKAPYRNGDLVDLLEPVRLVNDPFRLAFSYRQGRLDPLAPLAFKVLPREFGGAALESAGDERFALEPVGSGPFMVGGQVTEHGRTYLRFVANPYYQPPHGRSVPQIREVRFFVSKDPAADFAHQTAPLHLLLDARTQELGVIKKVGARLAPSAPERRVYFLAVNHRSPILADEKLRRALAHGIDRERLLTDHFGSGVPAFRAGPLAVWGATGPVVATAMVPGGVTHHHPLNGPYPAGSWAVCPDERVPARLANRTLAETFLQAAKAAVIDLELKYPEDDPRVEAACRAIAAQFADLGTKVGKPINLRLVALPSHQLQRDVQARQYQLAYWHHDYPNDLYSLWPLFDPRDEALETGSNFLGYKDDGSLVELLQKAASYRDFAQVKRLTHDIHVALFERMPLIPLWELEYHIAAHPSLVLPMLDPRCVFGTIGEWRLEKK
jgi:ABC-type transport system substrate-binding protein